MVTDNASEQTRLKQDLVFAERGCYFSIRWMSCPWAPQMSLLTLFLCPGISTLIAKGVYDAAFPLHDVSVRFERPVVICRKRPETGKCHASPRPFCFRNTVGSRSRHAPFNHLCPEKPIAPVALDVLSKFFFFFFFCFSSAGGLCGCGTC